MVDSSSSILSQDCFGSSRSFVFPHKLWASLVEMVENLPAMRKTWVRSLDWEDPLEEGMAAHSTILAWRILMDEGTWQAIVYRVSKSWT